MSFIVRDADRHLYGLRFVGHRNTQAIPVAADEEVALYIDSFLGHAKPGVYGFPNHISNPFCNRNRSSRSRGWSVARDGGFSGGMPSILNDRRGGKGVGASRNQKRAVGDSDANVHWRNINRETFNR